MKTVKVLHIDGDYRVIYILIREGSLIKTLLPLERAISLLNTEEFVLILFEPQNLAILHPQEGIAQAKPNLERVLSESNHSFWSDYEKRN
jgi:hypothetical protein